MNVEDAVNAAADWMGRERDLRAAVTAVMNSLREPSFGEGEHAMGYDMASESAADMLETALKAGLR